MIAMRPFSRKIGYATVNVKKGKEIPETVMSSYSDVEIKEMVEKKIIKESFKKVEKPKKESK